MTDPVPVVLSRAHRTRRDHPPHPAHHRPEEPAPLTTSPLPAPAVSDHPYASQPARSRQPSTTSSRYLSTGSRPRRTLT
jgi:hypothetical protein